MAGEIDSSAENVFIPLNLVKQSPTMIAKQVLKFRNPVMTILVPNMANGRTGPSVPNPVAGEPVERSGNANFRRPEEALKAALGIQRLLKPAIHRCVLFGQNGLNGPRVVPHVVAGNRKEAGNVCCQNLEPSNVQV